MNSCPRKEGQPLHLLTDLLRCVVVPIERLLLLVRFLYLHEAEERRHGHPIVVVNPSPDVCPIEGVPGEEVRGVLREGAFEKNSLKMRDSCKARPLHSITGTRPFGLMSAHLVSVMM